MRASMTPGTLNETDGGGCLATQAMEESRVAVLIICASQAVLSWNYIMKQMFEWCPNWYMASGG